MYGRRIVDEGAGNKWIDERRRRRGLKGSALTGWLGDFFHVMGALIYFRIVKL